MHAVAISYALPSRLEEAVALLVEQPDAMVLAGGQSLIQAANLREVSPSLLVDVDLLAELRGIAADASLLRIGAAEPMAVVEAHPLVRRHAPLLTQALATVGSVAIRNRATLGGSAAWADPTSQLPATLLALNATFVVTGPNGQRRIAASHLFTGPHSTALERGETICSVELPIGGDRRHGFRLVRRTAITWPVAGCAAVQDDDGFRLGLFGAGPTPVLARSIQELESHIQPFDDARATAAYRRWILPELARRALADAAAQSGE